MAQKGFTLIELAIVGIFLGLLAVFAISQFGGSATNTTRANAVNEAATKIADNWSIIAQQCNTSTDVTAISLTGGASPAANNLSMLVGNTQPSATYQACYNQSGVRPLAGISTGAAGAEQVQGYTVSVSNGTVGASNAMLVQLAGVPDSVTLALYNKLSSVAGANSATTVPAAADTTDPQIRFSTATAGLRTVTIVKVL